MSKKFQVKVIDLDSQNSILLFNELRKRNGKSVLECSIKLSEDVAEYKNSNKKFLIIDSGGFDNNLNRLALAKADAIITPVGISQIEVFGLQKFEKILEEAEKILKKRIITNILINNVDIRRKSKIQDLKNYVNENNRYLNLLNTVIHSRADFKDSYENGQTVEEFNKNSKSTKEIKSFLKEIGG